MANEKKPTFFGGVAILMVGSLLVKVIGAIYKIPLGNLLSNEAYVDFNTAYNVYNLFLTIATAGLPVALSKTVAEANALGRQNQVDRIFSVAFKTFLFMGTLSFLAMSVFGGPLSVLMGDDSAVYCVWALSPSVLCVCVMATFRGYYQGHSNMIPTAVSQVIESFGKLVFGLVLAWAVLNFLPGQDTYRQRMAAAGAILGVSIGSVIALGYIVTRYLRDRWARRGQAATDKPNSGRSILVRLLALAIPITLGSAAVSLVTIIDTKIVLSLLEKMYRDLPELITPEALAQQFTDGGVRPELYMAQGLKGIYDKCMAIYNLPSQLMVAITASVIPAVSACLARQDKKAASATSESALRIGVILAFPMGVGLFALAGPIVELLFPGKMDQSVAAPVMAMLGLASIFVCIMLLCNSILQASGHVGLPVISVVVGGVVKIVVNYLLVGNHDINIKGAPIGTLCCFATVSLLNMIFIRRVIPAPPNFLRAFAKPLAASVCMGAGAWAACGLASRYVGPRLGCLVGIAAGMALYFVLIILLKVFSKDDLALMPKGDKIARILRVR